MQKQAIEVGPTVRRLRVMQTWYPNREPPIRCFLRTLAMKAAIGR